jgi:hypothetical protein
MIFRAGFSYVFIYPLRSDILQYESSPEVVDAPENHHHSLSHEVKIFFSGAATVYNRDRTRITKEIFTGQGFSNSFGSRPWGGRVIAP